MNNKHNNRSNLDKIEKLVRLLILVPAAMEAAVRIKNQLYNWYNIQSTEQSTKKSTPRRKLDSTAQCKSSMNNISITK